MINKIIKLLQKLIHFFTIGIWNIDTNGIGWVKRWFYKIIKSFILTYRNIDTTKLTTGASALTYNTILAIIPLLAVLFAIARGFGLQNILQNELIHYFQSQEEVLKRAITFIDKSLKYAQSGIFLGIGVVLLLYTVINLISSIEHRFNTIWRIKKSRSYYRQFTDYLALILIAPVFIICNAGLSIFLGTATDSSVIGLVISPFLKILPYIITILLLTFLYIYIPNTKVNFSSALFAGIISGIAYQVFQEIYISGQIWISKYNAIYGSFAALPLLLLWMQLSWTIVLIGVELSFSYQNVTKFNFEKDIKNISRRYQDFTTLLLVSLITKRFEKGEKPYTANDLSEIYKIPTQLVSDTLYLLQQINIVIETSSDEDLVPAYIPAIDINKITIDYLFKQIDQSGSENFDIDNKVIFKNEWNAILAIRNSIAIDNKDILVKDL